MLVFVENFLMYGPAVLAFVQYVVRTDRQRAPALAPVGSVRQASPIRPFRPVRLLRVLRYVPIVALGPLVAQTPCVRLAH